MRLRAATDREISKRRAYPWQKIFRSLRFGRTRGHAAARVRRETRPTCIGTIGSFWVELPGGSRRVDPRRDRSRDLISGYWTLSIYFLDFRFQK